MGSNSGCIKIREKFLTKRKVNLSKMEVKIINGLVTPQYASRGCYKCKRLENICHAFFCNDEDIGDDWKSLLNMMKENNIDTKETERIIRNGTMTCNSLEGIEPNDMPQDIKLFTRGIFPEGIITLLTGSREIDINIVMSKF